MNRKDFLRLSGADVRPVEYMPIALLLRTGYGVAGYYNTSMNVALEDLIVLLNARLIDLRNRDGDGPLITDFNEFLQKVVFEQYKVGEGASESNVAKQYGNTIPLAAVSMSDIAVLYPVAQIARLMRLIKKDGVVGPLVVPQPTVEADAIIAHDEPDDLHVAEPVVNVSDIDVPAPDTADVPGDSMLPEAADTVPQPAGSSTPAVPVAALEATAPPEPTAPPLVLNEAAAMTALPAPTETDGTLDELAAAAIADPRPLTPEKIDEEDVSVPTFLDFNHKSIVLAVLRTKLW